MLRPIFNLMLVPAMSLSLASCQGARTDVGMWSAPPPDQTPAKWVRISDDRVRFIRPEKLSSAESLLKDASIRTLSSSDLVGLLQGDAMSAGSWYLVRGRSIKGATNGWRVVRSESGEALWVQWGTLSHQDIRISNNPILAMLASPPSRVFVTAAVAE